MVLDYLKIELLTNLLAIID